MLHPITALAVALALALAFIARWVGLQSVQRKSFAQEVQHKTHKTGNSEAERERHKIYERMASPAIKFGLTLNPMSIESADSVLHLMYLFIRIGPKNTFTINLNFSGNTTHNTTQRD